MNQDIRVQQRSAYLAAWLRGGISRRALIAVLQKNNLEQHDFGGLYPLVGRRW